MPFFDFVCELCGKTFESLVRSDPEQAAGQSPCPGCGSDKVMQQVSVFSLRGTKNQRRGKIVDLSSGSCPCAGHKHTYH